MTNDRLGAAPEPSPQIDTTVPHSARIWNYWLGGTDNYPVDRAAGAFFDGLELVGPGVVPLPRWRPDPGQPGPDVDSVGGIARKP